VGAGLSPGRSSAFSYGRRSGFSREAVVGGRRDVDVAADSRLKPLLQGMQNAARGCRPSGHRTKTGRIVAPLKRAALDLGAMQQPRHGAWHRMPPSGAWVQQPVGVDHALRRLDQAQAAVHGQAAQVLVGLLLAHRAVAHQQALGALDEGAV
jgi:hypothetical protein